MITESLREQAIASGERGILKQEIRSYEVSLWTLLDEFITVLKWSDSEHQGRIRDPKLTLNVDGTLNFTFTIPMYLNTFLEADRDNFRLHTQSQIIRKENPIWYNTRNGNLIMGMRKIKVIFNKSTPDQKVYDFIINKITEEHESELLLCKVECEGQAFHELGKIGYKYTLNKDTFELDEKDWSETGHWYKKADINREFPINTRPKANILYWCELCGLKPRPLLNINPREWYYTIDMNYNSFEDSIHREPDILYEEAYASSWDDQLRPLAIETYREKERLIDVKESNIYNITQTIAETFNVYCRYEFEHDDNLQIISRTIVFYNNYIKDKENVISFTYPYSSSSISREMDSTDLTTKMYVRCDDDSNTLEGTVSIINSEANKTGEDYLLNFDYFHDTGAITNELYEAISEYEKKMHYYNDLLNIKSLLVSALTTQKTELEAEILVLNNSISYDTELIDYASGLFNKITIDGYITRNEKNPYHTVIQTNKNTGEKYIKFNDLDKGIDTDSVRIYKGYNASTCELNTLIETSNYRFVLDQEYGDIERVALNVTLVSGESTSVYITYRYSPRLYYDSILQTWQLKKANDESSYGDKKEILDNLIVQINTLNEEYKVLLNLKNQSINEFNAMMGSALREGYWEPDEYKDEGEHYTESDTFTSTYSSIPLLADSGKGIKIGWDNELFDKEDKIYYEESVLLEKQYYPCIDISDSTLFNYIKLNFTSSNTTAERKISFIFQNNYYKDLSAAEKNLILNISNFTIGADALIGFIRTHDNNIKPVLVLTGTRNMTDQEIKFMLNPSLGNPRIGILLTTVDENTSIATTSISNNAIAIMPSMVYWDTNKIDENDRAAGLTGIINIRLCETVYPRIKFSSMRLKTEDEGFNILYTDNDVLLNNYIDYLILNRVTIRDDKAYPETFITIKPDTMILLGTYTGKITARYTLSNAATSIYLDAKDVLLESAYPKVSYTIKTNILLPELIMKLHTMLTLLVMINDVDLKFKNVFGYISQVILDLDQPQNDEVEVKNYKTKFEDLFSSIVALTEEMKRNNAGLAVAIAGGVPLSSAAFSNTILLNGDILLAYLDSYFDGSEVIQARLNLIFAEAGKILSDANTSLNNIRSSTVENATILGGFIENITNGLVPKVYTQNIKPDTYKVGDIWNKTENGIIVARYVATSDSKDSNNGWVRTFNGALASLTGASLDVDAVAGTVSILAENQIDIQSGGNVEIAANEDVNIYGNKSVNIGGTTINIGSTTIQGESVTGGINLVAAAYNTANITLANASKILISPTELNMSAADIYMKGGRKILSVASDGSANGTSAILISTTDGIWIGSGAGIKLYSGDAFNYNDSTKSLSEVSGASIELNSDHLLLGYSANASAAIEMTQDYLVIADGIAIPSTTQGSLAAKIATGITGLDSGLVGAKFTKSSIGLAVGTGGSLLALLMNNEGVSVGSGQIDLTQTTEQLRSAYLNSTGLNRPGTYMRLSGNGLEFGSMANIYINTNNFKLLTDSINALDLTKTDIGNTIMAVGKKLLQVTSATTIAGLRTMITNGEADVDLVLNKNGLYIKGTVFASAFLASCNEGYFRVDGNQLGFYDNTLTPLPMMTMTGRNMTCYGTFTIDGTNLFIGNSSFDTIQLTVLENSVIETVTTYHMHYSNSISNPPTPVGLSTTPDAGWTTNIPSPSGANVYLWSAIRTKYGNNTYYYSNVLYEGAIDTIKEVRLVEYARTSSTTAPAVTGNNVDSIWSINIPAQETTTSTITDPDSGWTKTVEEVLNPYVWRTIKTTTVDGTVTRSTPVLDVGISSLTLAGVTAANIANGTTAVPKVMSNGIKIDGNDLTVGSTGNLKLLGNSSVYIGANVSNLTLSAVILNKDGIAIGTNKSLALAGATIGITDSSGNNAVKLDGGGIEIYSGKKIKVAASDIELVAASGSTPAVTVATVKATAEQGVSDAANIANGVTSVPHVSTTGVTINSSGVTITSAAAFSLTTNGTINIQTGGIFKVNSNNFIVNSNPSTDSDSIFEVKYTVNNVLKTAIKSTRIGTTISGWRLENEWLWGGTKKNCVCLVSPNAANYSDGSEHHGHANMGEWAMYAGASWPELPPPSYQGTNYSDSDDAYPTGWAPFRVKRNGELYAKNICVGNGPSWMGAYNENNSSTYSTNASWAGYTGSLWFWAEVESGRYAWKEFDGNDMVLTVYLTTLRKDYGDGTARTITGTINAIWSTINAISSSCFLGGTAVYLYDGTIVPIEKLQLGMEILAYDLARNRFVSAPVKAIKAYPHHNNIYELLLSNGNSLFLTDDHPILTTEGWKVTDKEKYKKIDQNVEVETLLENNIVLSNTEEVVINHIIKRSDLLDVTVYNFDIEPYDAYIVEGIIAHNMKIM